MLRGLGGSEIWHQLVLLVRVLLLDEERVVVWVMNLHVLLHARRLIARHRRMRTAFVAISSDSSRLINEEGFVFAFARHLKLATDQKGCKIQFGTFSR